MKNYTSFITEPGIEKESQVNEFLGALLASACLSAILSPMFSGGKGDKDKGGSNFWDFLIATTNAKNSDDKDKTNSSGDDKEGDKKDDKDKTNPSEDDKMKGFNEMLLISRQANQAEKDETTKKKNDATIKILTACSFDENGNEIPIEERIKKMEDIVPADQLENLKKEMNETYEKVKDDDSFKESLAQARSKITPDTYQKALDDAKKEAKATLEQIAKEREAQEKYDEELSKLEEEIKTADDDKKKELIEKLEKIKKNPPQSMVSTATGGGGGGKSGEGESDEKTVEDVQKEYDKKLDDLTQKHDDKEKELENEYKEKIKNETDAAKKKDLEKELKDKKDANTAEWEKASKRLNAEKHKAMDDIDDNDEHTDEDDTKNGKYKVKDEEITDPDTGEKITVKTYTGPRGGKFYYPEGKPKKPENKVYVHESLKKYMTLSYYLKESLC